MAGELQAARGIQLAMLPPRERLAALDPRIDLDALLEPARVVGGDFYDALRLGRHVIGFVIGDVTGKGISAALFMAVSRALTRSALLREEGDLASAATRLDRELSGEDNPDLGVTMLLGSIDLATGAVTICNAGHENPLLVTADGTICALEMEGGPPLCTVEAYPYPAERMRIEPGEMLVLVSDGATEARSPAGELFGRVRLIEALHGSRSASAAAERVRDAVRRFEDGAEASDDFTILALRYLGETPVRDGIGDGPR